MFPTDVHPTACSRCVWPDQCGEPAAGAGRRGGRGERLRQHLSARVLSQRPGRRRVAPAQVRRSSERRQP